MKAFIVDDSELIRERLINMLSEVPGIEIIGQAREPVEATSSILKLNPDIVILDVRMPGGNGFDVLKNIKKNNSTPIVMILTSYSYHQYRKKCMELGANFFFDKSTEFDKITTVLEGLIGRDEEL